MSSIEKYVTQYLHTTYHQVEISHRVNELPELTTFEKTIIYKYTEDGYDPLNIDLRANNGRQTSPFGKFLEKSLKKLPNHIDVVYRSANLTLQQKQEYVNAFNRNSYITENCFLSSSKKRAIAMMFNGNCLFRISSKTGKDIEKIAKFGIGSGQNEYEIVFLPKRKFNVLEIVDNDSYTLITLEEVA